MPQFGEQREFLPGTTSGFIVVLVGAAVHLLPSLAAAVALLGERGRFALRSVTQQQPAGAATEIWDAIDDPLDFYRQTSSVGFEYLPIEPLDQVPLTLSEAPALEVSFYTPLRLEQKGHLCRGAPAFRVLLERFCKRIDLLGQLYADCVLPDASGLLRWSQEVQTVSDGTSWYDWERCSSRHGRQLFGGLVGPVVYQGPDMTPFLPFLHAGALLGIGKGTPMGMGRFVISLPGGI